MVIYLGGLLRMGKNGQTLKEILLKNFKNEEITIAEIHAIKEIIENNIKEKNRLLTK